MAGAAPQGNQSDNSYSLLWGVAAIFAVVGGSWYVFKENIIAFYLLIKIYELKFISFVTYMVLPSGYFTKLQNTLSTAYHNPTRVTFDDLAYLGGSVGEWLRYPFVVTLVVMAVLVYGSSTARMFRRTYKMLELAKLEKANWPQITPVVDLDLIKVDIDKGPWAMAMNPMQFCKRYDLLDEVRPARKEGMARKDWDKVEVVLRRGQANKIFALQLGPLWKGTEHLPKHTRALFAAFAARINADSKPAAKILRQLSVSCMNSEMDYTGVDELIKKHENTKLVQQIVKTHAYVATMMASMLERARDDGVQASADFLWLKPLDRKLWYILNTVGRQTPFIEIAGIFAHWIAEKEAQRKLLVPMVEEATNAVELALKDILYKRDETET